jgi:predicted site-specific integrase-resolvase
LLIKIDWLDLAREYFERLATLNGCELIVVNQESLSPQQEMVEDLMAIIQTFSCRLYGLRKSKKDIKKVIINESDSNSQE